MPTGPGSSSGSPSISPRCSPASRSSRGYHPLGSEISPLPAMEEARAVGAIVAFPCFANPAKPFRFLAGDPLEPGPFGIMQPAKRHPAVEPELVLVPLIAIDGAARGSAAARAITTARWCACKKSKARLVGVGWPLQRLTETIPARRVGRPARRLRLARRDRDLQALSVSGQRLHHRPLGGTARIDAERADDRIAERRQQHREMEASGLVRQQARSAPAPPRRRRWRC